MISFSSQTHAADHSTYNSCRRSNLELFYFILLHFESTKWRQTLVIESLNPYLTEYAFGCSGANHQNTLVGVGTSNTRIHLRAYCLGGHVQARSRRSVDHNILLSTSLVSAGNNVNCCSVCKNGSFKHFTERDREFFLTAAANNAGQ